MPHIRLIHWNAAEAAERAARLANDEVRVDYAPLEPSGLRALRAEPPDAVVIDLSRLPSYGRDLGAALRQTKATREIPLLFVDGDPAKVARVRELLRTPRLPTGRGFTRRWRTPWRIRRRSR